MNKTLVVSLTAAIIGAALVGPADAQTSGSRSSQTSSYAPLPAAGASTGPVHSPGSPSTGSTPAPMTTQSFAPPPVPVAPPPPPPVPVHTPR